MSPIPTERQERRARLQTGRPMRTLIDAVRQVAGDEASSPEDVLALLWLIQTSEHCQRTLEAVPPEREEVDALARRLGAPAQAWVQFSPPACDLLYGDRSPAIPEGQARRPTLECG